MAENRLAALDLGTNSLIMLVVEVHSLTDIRQLHVAAALTRIGYRIQQTGTLNQSAARRTTAAVMRFKTLARRLDAERIIACATSALRDARDGTEYLAVLSARSGIAFRLISGEEEARLTALALSQTFADRSPQLFGLDIGGGSTEISVSERGVIRELHSLDIGAVRFSERYIHHDPPHDDEVESVIQAVEEKLPRLAGLETDFTAVACGGTMDTLQKINLQIPFDRYNQVEATDMHRNALNDITGHLLRSTLAERRVIMGMEPQRADIIPAGALIARTIMEHYHIPQLLITEKGIRWGMVYDYLRSRQSAGK